MCQYSVDKRDGIATDWHLVHYGSRAVGGTGIVMSEAVAVEPRGRISPEDLGLWNDAQRDALEPIASFIREQGSVPAIQLAHAGRKASFSRPRDGANPLGPEAGGWPVVGASEAPWPRAADTLPTSELTLDGIDEVVEAFRNSAELAAEAGFEIAEVHAAHGYLLHQFLSPVTNDRTDRYGGSFENRTRLLREVIRAIRGCWPDEQPLFVRISATDWLEDQPSWTLADSVQLADELFELGVDLIDVSSGGISPASSPPWTGPNYQARLAETIKTDTSTDILVGTVGGVTTPQQAEALIRNERADLCIMGREFLRNPYFALEAAETLDEFDRLEPPVQYQRGF